MTHIKKQKNDLNLNKDTDLDTELLDESYFNVLDKLCQGYINILIIRYF